ncbi:MAG TPA: type II secretion system F family protein [Acetobacteraceae bacterium]|jgi:tight adherence protein C|nr:type II secretion system F family protein [Acetobacteraceae bacterium]
MNLHVLIGGGLLFVLVLAASSVWMLREMHRETRLAARIRLIHGQTPAARKSSERAAVYAAIVNGVAAVGKAILRSGVVSARTLSELENTVSTSGLRGAQGVGLFIGSKLLLMVGLPVIFWLLLAHWGFTGLMTTLLPGASGVIGLLAPDWVIGHQRKQYLARIENGLPDALDMLVICTQAGLGLGPAIIRVAAELQHAYREISQELEMTANELQVMSDARLAILNLGTRTGLDSLKRLSTTLAQTLQYGTPISDALRVLSSEMRQEMLTRFEARAARLPVLLTMPTIAFILPCVFLIAGGPAMIQVMRAFHH